SRDASGAIRARPTPTLQYSAPSKEASERPADLVRGILLDEVTTAYRDLGLVGPAPTELPLGTHEDRAGVGVDEELRDRALRQPLAVIPDDADDVRGLSVHRDLARPGARGWP